MSPMKGSLTSAFAFLTLWKRIIHFPPKYKSLTETARPNERDIIPLSISSSLPISLGRLKDVLII